MFCQHLLISGIPNPSALELSESYLLRLLCPAPVPEVGSPLYPFLQGLASSFTTLELSISGPKKFSIILS
jgi:hypothetical protein